MQYFCLCYTFDSHTLQFTASLWSWH